METMAVLPEQWGVVGCGQLEAFAVENGDVGIEERVAEAHPLDLSGETLALLTFDGEVIDVLVIDDALHRDIERDRLRCGEVAVRLVLLHDGQITDPEGAHVGDAGLGADAEDMFAEPAIRGNLDRGLELIVVDGLQFGDGETRGIAEDLLGVAEPGTMEEQDGIDAALTAARRDAAQGRRRSRRQRCDQRQGEQRSRENDGVRMPCW